MSEKKHDDNFVDENDDVAIDDEEVSGVGSQVQKGVEDIWSSVVKPYKYEVIRDEMMNHEPGDERRAAVINCLRDYGVKVFIIEAKSIETTADILHHVHRVIDYVSRENQMHALGALDENGEPVDPLGFQRCLLYQDRSGRLFNLMVASHAVGPSSQFEALQTSFSGMEAMAATVILCRSFACATDDENLDVLTPGRLSLILGLVFFEELSLAYTFAQMFVRCSPSISAHTLTTFVDSDLPRKLVVFLLAVAPSAGDNSTRGWITIAGIALACAVFLANLGSRAWHFMGWKPFPYQGPFSAPLACLAAIFTGGVFPYMGHRKVRKGGRVAMEHIITTAVIVAVVFMVSDIDEVQRFLVVGSENCNQDNVNIAVGAWWTFTFVSSLIMTMSIPSMENISPQEPEEEEPLLIQDHASPVGYKVPVLPDFELDPTLANNGALTLCSSGAQLFLGLILAVIFGGGIIYLGFVDDDDDFWGRML